jgi:hypothetical protein
MTNKNERAERLAAALLADQQRTKKTTIRASDCRACGRSFVNAASDCCSPRCEEWIAAGNPTHDPNFAQRCIDLPPPEPPGIRMRSWKLVAGNPDLKCAPDMKVGDTYCGPILDHYWTLRKEREMREKKARATAKAESALA